MDTCGDGIPQVLVDLDERIELARRELDALVTQRGQRLAWVVDELASQFFVGEDPADEQLYGFLRHDARSATPIAQRSIHGGRASQCAISGGKKLWTACQ